MPEGDSRIYQLVFYAVVLGSLGQYLGWWSWVWVVYSLIGFSAASLLLSWLAQPTRYRGRTFAEFTEFLAPWAVSIDRGGRIFIEPERLDIPRLRFRVTGRGARKRLRVRLPTRRQSRLELRTRLEALTAPFENAAIRDHPRSIELSLPSHAAYAGSVASRSAEAAFRALGCGADTRFTIYCEGNVDPHYDLEVTEAAADGASGWLKRLFERRARSIRHGLRRRRTPPGGSGD